MALNEKHKIQIDDDFSNLRQNNSKDEYYFFKLSNGYFARDFILLILILIIMDLDFDNLELISNCGTSGLRENIRRNSILV